MGHREQRQTERKRYPPPEGGGVGGRGSTRARPCGRGSASSSRLGVGRGRWRLGRTRRPHGTKGLHNGFDDPFGLAQHLAVPEAQHAKTMGLEPFGACCVIGHLVGMVLAVNLDDEPAVKADEVHDVSAEGHLTTKAIAELLFPKMTPEQSFGISHFAAEPTGSSLDDGFDAASIGASPTAFCSVAV